MYSLFGFHNITKVDNEMSLKQFTIFFISWILSCALIFEPAFVAPLFETSSTLAWAFMGNSIQLGEFQLTEHSAATVKTMDYFRSICLLYFGLPISVYLGSQWKKS
jgi:hypothetical protein